MERRLAVIDCGSNSFRLVVFTYTDTWWKRTDEIHEAVRVGEGLEATGAPSPRRWSARSDDARGCTRTSARRRGSTRSAPSPPRRSATRPTRRSSSPRRASVRARGSRCSPARRGALRVPRRGEHDDAGRRRRPGPRRRLDAAHPRGRPARGRRALVAARRRAHDRALQPGQEEADGSAARAHRRRARERHLARRGRAARRRRRHGPQPRRRRAARGRHAVLRHSGLSGHT